MSERTQSTTNEVIDPFWTVTHKTSGRILTPVGGIFNSYSTACEAATVAVQKAGGIAFIAKGVSVCERAKPQVNWTEVAK